MEGKEVAVVHGASCGATARSGDPCQQPAGFGTDHVGQGRCKFHGGASPIRHGRYSAIERPELAALIERYEGDPDPLDLIPELATMRALFDGFVSRYDELVEALMEWNAEEYQDASDARRKPRPQRIPPLESVAKLLSEITKIVKRIEDIRAQNAVSRPALFRILREMGAVVRRHNDIEDPARRLKAIEDDWGRITV